MGAVITVLFVLLVFPSPKHNIDIWFITYPANLNVLVSLVSFAVSGIYLSFLLAVIASIVAHARGWKAEGAFRLGRWTWPVLIIAAAYLGLMLVNVVAPTGLTSPRALFNYDWITAAVMFVIALVGAILFLVTRPDRKLRTHLHDELEPSGAERVAPAD
jgi:amino acid transporter